jgi:hypothetical protein
MNEETIFLFGIECGMSDARAGKPSHGLHTNSKMVNVRAIVSMKRSVSLVGVIVLAWVVCTRPCVGADAVSSTSGTGTDQAVSLRFSGSPDAELFTKELDASFQGVLEKNFVSVAGNGFPAGFVNASLPGFPWAGTMWTRDGGTFMRELVMRGYLERASLLAECLMHLVKKNPDGFYSFPEYFKGSQPGSGAEMDGTTSIVIGMVLLWERLPAGDSTKGDIQRFLFQDASPINSIEFELRTKPLIEGSGEFGCGLGVPGLCYNVAQNSLVRLALLAAARMAGEAGDNTRAEKYRHLAERVENAMEKYLVAEDGGWIWCIDEKTMKPDPRVLNAEGNKGIGSINGVASMYADVLGLQPLNSSWKAGAEHSQKTFERLYNTPLRKKEFDNYGIWTQFDLLAGGLLSSPSYGQGYAIQTMLLFDNLTMAGKALSWLANATYRPVSEYKLHRDSPYFFYERTYSPDAVGKIPLAEGCGALNLVNVSEPLKVSRLMLGVDDSSPQTTLILPRLPDSWTSVAAHSWPILTTSGLVRAEISFEKKGTGGEFTMKLAPGQQINDLKVRMPSKDGYVWREEKYVKSVHFVTR